MRVQRRDRLRAIASTVRADVCECFDPNPALLAKKATQVWFAYGEAGR